MAIILPSIADQKKTFHALRVPPYLRNGVVRGHIDPVLIAAFCFTGALQQGCEDIVVGLEGMIPRRYSLRSVWEEICRNPAKFRGWYRPPITDPIEAQRERIIRHHFQPSV